MSGGEILVFCENGTAAPSVEADQSRQKAKRPGGCQIVAYLRHTCAYL